MNNIKFTQEDAEYLAEWFNFVNSKSFGILSEEFKNEVIKADIIRGNLTQLMYENSNWRIKRKYRKGKYSKAIKIYQQLILNFPEKSTFFASRIRFGRRATSQRATAQCH